MKDEEHIEGIRKTGMRVTLTEEEVNDIKMHAEARKLLGFEPEFEIIGDPDGEYNIGRERRLTKTEYEAICDLVEEAKVLGGMDNVKERIELERALQSQRT